MSAALFPLGQCVITPGAKALLEAIGVEPLTLLRRHQFGDWKEMDKRDQAANRAAITDGSRVFSAYTLSGDNRVYVITEADRSSTTILLPEEY